MSTISYRRLNSNYEPQFNGPGLTDIDAVGQTIMTRLRLFEGEWWEDQSDGLPLFQSILGQGVGNDQEAVNLLITSRIYGGPYIQNVYNTSSSYSASTRAYSFSTDVITQFGVITVTNIPTPPPQGVLS